MQGIKVTYQQKLSILYVLFLKKWVNLEIVCYIPMLIQIFSLTLHQIYKSYPLLDFETYLSNLE